MYEIVKHVGEGPRHPLNYEQTEVVKPFNKLRQALAYWKEHQLWGTDGYYLVVIARGVQPTALRLNKEHFV